MSPLTVFAATLALFGQDAAPKSDYSADTKTVESTVLALYDVISGPAEKKRDWARFRNLFAPGARMVPNFKRGDKFATMVLTTEDYVTKAGPALEKDGFFEKEVSRKVEEYGPIAHVFTTYESRLKSPEEKPFDRGINSVQLSFDGERWWIQSIVWAGESAAGPIPSKYGG
ncbi:MAG: hypothetical protein JST30_08455 [Armatimonadetes bacterium]|nr:hypothetical protein [Armatimonadota bacterium]